MKFLFPIILIASPAESQTSHAVGTCSTNLDCVDPSVQENKYIARTGVVFEQKNADNAFVFKLPMPTPPAIVAYFLPLVATLPVMGAPHHTNSLLPYIDVGKIPAAARGIASARIRDDTVHAARQSTDDGGQFRTICTFSHMNYDDAIVYPGQKGASHLHTYFGNTAADYTSTKASIETTGNSTCSGGTANRTGYWIPALIDTKDGTPLKPDSIMIYYKTGYIEGDYVKPFPAGLRMIAGDMKSSSSQPAIYWFCTTPTGDAQTSHGAIPVDCPVGYTITASINFPFCWDGVNLDSPDHKSHMSWNVWNNDTRKTQCPTTHPVELPMITENIKYKVTEAGATARWRLASDNYDKTIPGGYSLHADWFNGWDPKVLETFVKNCLQANKDCGVDVLGDGTRLY